MRILVSRPLVVFATVGALVAAGCGGADTETSAGSGTAPPPSVAGAIDHATGPTDIVLRVNTGGGFVPVEFNLKSLPSYTLYGDGTVIRPVVTSADVAQAPNVTPLETIKLDEAAIQSLLEQAKSAGLLAPGTVDYGDMGALGVSDMPTTSVTLNADGIAASHDAYGLLFAPTEQPAGTLTQAQRDARAALRGFVALTEQQDPNATAYAPTRLAVWVAPALAQPTGRLRADRLAARHRAERVRHARRGGHRLPLHRRRGRRRGDPRRRRAEGSGGRAVDRRGRPQRHVPGRGTGVAAGRGGLSRLAHWAAGWMFWFTRSRLDGSYFALTRVSRR